MATGGGVTHKNLEILLYPTLGQWVGRRFEYQGGSTGHRQACRHWAKLVESWAGGAAPGLALVRFGWAGLALHKARPGQACARPGRDRQSSARFGQARLVSQGGIGCPYPTCGQI